MVDYILNFELNSLLGVALYWTPFIVCTTVYAFRFVRFYREDLSASTEKFYRPQLTIGQVVAWLLISITPIVNLLWMIFDCSGSVIRWLSDVLDMPLVKAKNH